MHIDGIEAIRRFLEDNPSVFPNTIALERYGIPNRIILGTNLEPLQIRWIEQASNEDFIAAFSSKKLTQVSKKVELEKNKRLRLIIIGIVVDNPSIYPTVEKIVGFMGISRGSIERTIDMEELQIRWIDQASNEDFIAALLGNKITGYHNRANKKADERLRMIIRETLHDQPEVFPTARAVAGTIGPNQDMILRRIDLEELQIEWIKRSSTKDFADVVNSPKLNSTTKRVRSEAYARVERTVKEALDANPSVFPSVQAIKRMCRFGIRTLAKIGVRDLQMQWTQRCDDKDIIDNISSSRIIRVSEEVNTAVDMRLRRIIEGELKIHVHKSVESIAKALRLGARSIRERIPEIRDLIATSCALYGICAPKRSVDQEIVSRIGIFVAKRARWIRKLIEKRLEQLWVFRELVALLKTGYTNVTVVSFTHQSLPRKLEAVVAGCEVRHYFLDAITHGSEIELSGDVILPSILSFIGPELSARIIRNLAISMPEGSNLIFTHPQNSELTDKGREGLEELGFEVERIGFVTLKAAQGTRRIEAEKLNQESRVAILRRTSSIPSGLDNLELFERLELQTHRSREIRSNRWRTYSKRNLQRATPTLVLGIEGKRKEESIVLSDIVFGSAINDGFILEFEDGTVAGYNMDLKRPNTIEVRGRSVSNGVVHSFLGIINRSASNNDREKIKVPESMKKRYDEFRRATRTRRFALKKSRKRRITATVQTGKIRFAA